MTRCGVPALAVVLTVSCLVLAEHRELVHVQSQQRIEQQSAVRWCVDRGSDGTRGWLERRRVNLVGGAEAGSAEVERIWEPKDTKVWGQWGGM